MLKDTGCEQSLTRYPRNLRPSWNSLRLMTRNRLPNPVFLVLLAAFCLLPSAFSVRAANGLYEVQEVKPGVFVWIPDDVLDQDGDPQFSRAGAAGFIITAEGVVVVDTTNSPFHARELLYEIRERTEAPVRYVINTGADGDRMLGNEVFAELQATLISAP